MSTFILKWNPAISSFKMDDCKRMCRDFPFGHLNWSVWDFENANQYDDFYMLRVGEGNVGIVMKGTFASRPYRGSDWSGKGRTTYYCDLNISFIVDSETQPIITPQQLETAIPDFDWRAGHSGVALSATQASILDALFDSYKKSNADIFDDLYSRSSLVVQESALKTIRGGGLWKEMFADFSSDELFTDIVTQDCVNLSLSIDYEAHELQLEVLFQDQVLHITCRDLYEIKANLSANISLTDSFTLSRAFTDAYLLESNGVRIVCGDIEFDSITKFDEDSYPVTI